MTVLFCYKIYFKNMVMHLAHVTTDIKHHIKSTQVMNKDGSLFCTAAAKSAQITRLFVNETFEAAYIG